MGGKLRQGLSVCLILHFSVKTCCAVEKSKFLELKRGNQTAINVMNIINNLCVCIYSITWYQARLLVQITLVVVVDVVPAGVSFYNPQKSIGYPSWHVQKSSCNYDSNMNEYPPSISIREHYCSFGRYLGSLIDPAEIWVADRAKYVNVVQDFARN